jgi:hypothetical protein
MSRKFKIRRRFFMQVFTAHGLYHKKAFPFVYTFLENKSKVTYTTALHEKELRTESVLAWSGENCAWYWTGKNKCVAAFVSRRNEKVEFVHFWRRVFSSQFRTEAFKVSTEETWKRENMNWQVQILFHHMKVPHNQKGASLILSSPNTWDF